MKLLTYLITLFSTLLISMSSGLCAQPKNVDIQSIQADFTQEKHLKILARPLISTGKFTFAAPQSLRWEYTTPIRSILLMHGGKIRKYTVRNGEFVEDQGMRLDSMQIVLAEISNWLDGRFTENNVFKVSFADPKTVLLLPKEQSFANLISRIELQLADQQGLLDKVTIFEGPDSYTIMTFTNRVLNTEIPAAVFSAQ
jgi:outer membrane lipoprotein-sorting protein